MHAKNGFPLPYLRSISRPPILPTFTEAPGYGGSVRSGLGIRELNRYEIILLSLGVSFVAAEAWAAFFEYKLQSLYSYQEDFAH